MTLHYFGAIELAQVLLEKLKQAIAKDGAKGYCKRRVENTENPQSRSTCRR